MHVVEESNAAVEIDLASLPDQMRQIIKAIGLSATERLLEARGGTRLKRPHTPKSWQLFSTLLDDEALAETFWNAFPLSEHIELPTAKKLDAARRNGVILSLRGSGITAREIALRYGITQAYVRMIWNGDRPIYFRRDTDEKNATI